MPAPIAHRRMPAVGRATAASATLPRRVRTPRQPIRSSVLTGMHGEHAASTGPAQD